jgi:hypothetical protein
VNFRLLGDCLLWAFFMKITEVDKIFVQLFSTVPLSYVLTLSKMGMATFWAIFHKLIWSPSLWANTIDLQLQCVTQPLLFTALDPLIMAPIIEAKPICPTSNLQSSLKVHQRQMQNDIQTLAKSSSKYNNNNNNNNIGNNHLDNNKYNHSKGEKESTTTTATAATTTSPANTTIPKPKSIFKKVHHNVFS